MSTFRYCWCAKCHTEWKGQDVPEVCPECGNGENVLSSKHHEDEKLIAQVAATIYLGGENLFRRANRESVQRAIELLAETRRQLAEEK